MIDVKLSAVTIINKENMISKTSEATKVSRQLFFLEDHFSWFRLHSFRLTRVFLASSENNDLAALLNNR